MILLKGSIFMLKNRFCPMKIAYKRKVFSKELEKILRLNFLFF